jgi:hypothetical protein
MQFMDGSNNNLPLMDVDGKLLCHCPQCQRDFKLEIEGIEGAMEGYHEGALDPPASDVIEDLEALRRDLGALLKKDVLEGLMALYELLDKDPQQTKMYCWFTRNGTYGRECKYATLALKSFKENRLDKVLELLESVTEGLKKKEKDNA